MFFLNLQTFKKYVVCMFDRQWDNKGTSHHCCVYFFFLEEVLALFYCAVSKDVRLHALPVLMVLAVIHSRSGLSLS